MSCPRNSSYKNSRIYGRLLSCEQAGDDDDDRHAKLRISVNEVVKEAGELTETIRVHMPHYTHHGKVHFRNVLWIMDRLIPDEILENMHPLECALCIMAASVHDLGMTLSDDDHAKLDEESNSDCAEFEKFIGQYSSLKEKIIDGLPNARTREREGKKFDELFLERFLRETHAEPYGRLSRRLTDIANAHSTAFVFCNCDFKDRLCLIAASHGHALDWLRTELVGIMQEDELVSNLGEGIVNWMFPALLLRLADVLDLGYDRASPALYKFSGLKDHLDVKNELDKAIQYSRTQWGKHLSETGAEIESKEKPTRIIWEGECDDPVVHNELKNHERIINNEIQAVKRELEKQRSSWKYRVWRYDLHLPDSINFRVRPKTEKGIPAYTVDSDGMAVVSVAPPESHNGNTKVSTPAVSLEKDHDDIRQVVGELKRLQVLEITSVVEGCSRSQKN